MAEPRYLDITPENFKRTHTGAGKGDMRGTKLMSSSEACREAWDRIFGNKQQDQTNTDSKETDELR